MDGSLGVNDRKLHHDADAQRHLVRGQNLLAFDDQLTRSHIDKHDLDDFRATKRLSPGRDLEAVATCAQYSLEGTIAVEQPTMRVLNDVIGLVRHEAASSHGAWQNLRVRPRTRRCGGWAGPS